MHSTLATQTRRWTYREFERLGELGFFRHQRVELIGGRIIQMPPQLDRHAAGIELGRRTLDKTFGPRFWIRVQLPLQMGKWSGPEPDLAVVPGGPRDYIGTGHPKSALLIIEVSEKTLLFDRQVKAGLYAKYGISDYWILNLVDRRVEVHRNPVVDSSHRFGYRYTAIVPYTAGQIIQPLAAKGSIRVDDLLP